jgi:nicotinamide-nucleotide amidase
MKAEIIAIGSELTCGARLDTNSQWLSCELEALGWTVQRHTTVADGREAMVRVFQEAAQRSRIVLITGGLGPTLDDITREALADAVGQELVEDPESLQHIESLFRSRGREMPERNKVQALRPAGAVSLHNAHGTAPGILLELPEPHCLFAVMPGVPAEMRRMFHEELVQRLPASDVYVQRTMIRTFGYGESDAERLLGELTARGRNPEVGITASDAVISLSITARAGSQEECRLLSDAVRDEIKARLGHAVFGEGDADLYQVLGQQLIESNSRVALLEGTTTGGLVGHWLTETPQMAQQVAFSQLYPVPECENGDWQSRMRDRANEILQNNRADFVLTSSHSEVQENSAGVRLQTGTVMLLGAGTERLLDVSMSGNLAIFRPRAARQMLNLLRLHFLNLADR